jgi:hypothetical protein
LVLDFQELLQASFYNTQNLYSNDRYSEKEGGGQN